MSQAAIPNAQADRLLSNARTAVGGAAATPGAEDAKIEKAGKDFESILLGSWLQKAEETFAKVPGGDGQDDDDDSGKDQFQGISMQALAGSLTASGGIGIAKMITSNLRASAQHKSESADAPKVVDSGAQAATKG
jgi:Rod binding domain-containing protein